MAWGGPTRFCTPTRSNQSYSRSSCAGPYKLHWGVRICILSILKMIKLSTTMWWHATSNIAGRNTRVANGNLWVPWKVQEGAWNPLILRARGAKVHVSLTHCSKYSDHARLGGISTRVERSCNVWMSCPGHILLRWTISGLWRQWIVRCTLHLRNSLLLARRSRRHSRSLRRQASNLSGYDDPLPRRRRGHCASAVLDIVSSFLSQKSI